MYIYHRLGEKGEKLACDYLKKKKYKIIDKNFKCKFGEIDIIAKEKDEYVFVEVKTRSNCKYGTPSEAVNYFKQKHIISVSEYFMYINKLENKKIRFDIIEIYIQEKIKINHIKNCFI